jgi:hypothetical protein
MKNFAVSSERPARRSLRQVRQVSQTATGTIFKLISRRIQTGRG